MRIVRLFCAVVAALVATSPSLGDEVSDVPLIVANGHISDQSMMSVRCTEPRVSRSGLKVTQCITVQVMVQKQQPEKIREQIETLEMAQKSPQDVKSLLKIIRCDTFKDKRGMTPEAAATTKRARDACIKRDGAALARATIEWVENVEAYTCKLDTTIGTWDFVQVDNNTWRHVSERLPTCGITMVLTLWRSPGAKQWNFQQVRSGPPNAPGPEVEKPICDAIAANPVMKFDAGDSHVRSIECRYFEF